MTAVVEVVEPEELFEWFVEQRQRMGLTGVPLGEGSSAGAPAGPQEGRARRARQRPRPGGQRGGGRVLRRADDAARRRGHPGPAHRGAAACRWCLLGPGATGTRAWCTRRSTRRGAARCARTSPGSPRSSPTCSRATSGASPSSGTSTSPTGRATPADRHEGRHGLSPYALTRHGGVQGQAIGLARALRAPRPRGDGRRSRRSGRPFPEAVGEHYVVGRPTGVHSNGSVAPVALSPALAARAERFIRAGGFDVVHVHEPLAPHGRLRPRAAPTRCRWSAPTTVRASASCWSGR